MFSKGGLGYSKSFWNGCEGLNRKCDKVCSDVRKIELFSVLYIPLKLAEALKSDNAESPENGALKN